MLKEIWLNGKIYPNLILTTFLFFKIYYKDNLIYKAFKNKINIELKRWYMFYIIYFIIKYRS
jgi:hypothetical protein